MAAKRILIVAHETAQSPELLDAVRRRAAEGDTRFTLVVPNKAHGLHRVVDSTEQSPSEAEAVLGEAIPALEAVAGAQVKGIVGDPNPLDAVQDAVNLEGFDEIIVSTLPHTVSRWLKLDLPHKLEGLGLPITTVTAQEPAATIS